MEPQIQHFIDAAIREFRVVSGILVAPGIPEKKLRNAISKNGYTGSSPILGLIDCTVFGSAKENVMFTASGVYWKQMGRISGQITYADLLRTTIKSGGFFASQEVVTGLGQSISINGSNINRRDFLNLLIQIKNLYGAMVLQQTSIAAPTAANQEPTPQKKSKADLLAHAHNMSEARNWKAAINAYEEAGEFRMAGLVREQEARWNKEHGL